MMIPYALSKFQMSLLLGPTIWPHQFRINKNIWRASKPLELIHLDECGSMRTTSIRGIQYMITFIGDFSMKIQNKKQSSKQ